MAPKNTRNMSRKDKRSFCEKCKKQFSFRQGYERHPCYANKSFDCLECGKLFPRKDNLKRHQEACKGYKMSHVCQQCKKEYQYKSKRLCHLETHKQ